MPRDPAALRQVAAQLKAGAVLKLYSPIAENYKRQVLIYAGGDRSLAFLINTRLAPLIVNDPDRSCRHIMMSKALHPFMAHDSYIACDDTIGIACGPGGVTGTVQHLIEAILIDQVKILGMLHSSLFPNVMAAASGSRLIADRDAAIIMTAFTT